MPSESREFKKEFKNRVYQFVLRLIRFADRLPNDSSSRVIKEQLIRSGSSVGANYIEAEAASSSRDFANFFSYALKSANETKFWLSLLQDLEKASWEETEQLLAEVSEIANVLASSIIKLRGRK